MFEKGAPLPAPPAPVSASVSVPVPGAIRKNSAAIFNESDHETDVSKFSNKLIPR